MEILSEIRRPVEEAWGAYERLVHQSLTPPMSLEEGGTVLRDVLHYVGTTRGKQLRPLVVLLSARVCNPITEKTLRTAVALEMLHNASLIHDDVVDSSETRRGSAAVHTKWNNKVAVLAGDYMLAKVISLIAEVRNIRIIEIVSQLGRSLSSGELLQLHAGQSMWIDEARYFQVIDQKTAQLFQSCAEAGAESSGCTPRQRAALSTYGRMLGICFQLKDDLFDYSDLDDLGKPTMSDFRDGKVTLPLIVALQRAPQPEAERIKSLSPVLAQGDGEEVRRALEEVKSFVLRFKGDEYVVQRMHEYRRRAIEALSVFRDSDVKSSLIALLDYAIDRIK